MKANRHTSPQNDPLTKCILFSQGSGVFRSHLSLRVCPHMPFLFFWFRWSYIKIHYKSPHLSCKFSHVSLNPLNAFMWNFDSATQRDDRWSSLSTGGFPGPLQDGDILWSSGSLRRLRADNAEPLPVPDVLLLCVHPFVEERPGVNGEGFLLIHAAVK